MHPALFPSLLASLPTGPGAALHDRATAHGHVHRAGGAGAGVVVGDDPGVPGRHGRPAALTAGGRDGRPGLWCRGPRGGAGARVAGLIPGLGRGDPGGLLREKARQKLAGVLAEISTHS